MAKGKKTGGRKAGTPNKTTREVKAALEACYEAIGGDVNFAAWAAVNSTEFYKLWAKLIPVQVNHADNEGEKLDGFKVILVGKAG